MTRMNPVMMAGVITLSPVKEHAWYICFATSSLNHETVLAAHFHVRLVIYVYVFVAKQMPRNLRRQ